jgi:hypothetical protein
MTDLRKAAEMALAKLDHLWEIAVDERMGTDVLPEIKALRQALAQPEQEPVAWIMEMPPPSGADRSVRMTSCKEVTQDWENAIPLYTAPPKREWVGLTDEEKSELANKYKHIETGWYHDMDLIAEVEAKLKEKNSG